jgi:hypothetical protein
MSEPRRLRDGTHALSRDLLRSADEDQPSRSSKVAAMAALGLAQLPPAGPGAGSAGSAGPLAAAGAGGKLGALAVAGLVAAVSAAGVGTAWMRRGTAPIRAPSAIEARAQLEPAVEACAKDRAWFCAAPGDDLQSMPPEPPTRTGPRTPKRAAAPGRPMVRDVSFVASPSVAAGSAGLRLAEELMLIDRARAAIADHDAARARQILRAHDLDFGQGPLAPEAAALAIEASIVEGRTDDARDALRTFEESYPHSPLRARLESLLREQR